jgi:pimeloyl-ACP methyl ester carboxylesterase
MIAWLQDQTETQNLIIGLFGTSKGATAALIAAAQDPDVVRAVVSRGGRPDLASDSLSRVQAPTLLIVGGRDTPVIDVNHDAMGRMQNDIELEIVPDATHLFQEPGVLEQVAGLAAEWLKNHLPA